MATVARPIFLLSDFGLRDSYVGQMKAVIASIAPGCPIHDITHDVEPFAVDEGAWLLETALALLPEDAVVAAVVDPGVGTTRRALVIQASGRTFVGPDNGLLSAVIGLDRPRVASDAHRSLAEEMGRFAVPSEGGLAVRELCEPSVMRKHISATFHGRDVFAPAAAHIASGADYRRVGPPLREIATLQPFCGATTEMGVIEGYVVHIDRFGNLITTVRAAQLFPAFSVEIDGRTVDTHVRTFGEVAKGIVFCHVDSSGYLAVAQNHGSAAVALGARRGATVRVRRR